MAELVVDGRVSITLMLLPVALAMIAGVSAQALTDRIFRTRQLPYAHSRVLSVLIFSITVAL